MFTNSNIDRMTRTKRKPEHAYAEARRRKDAALNERRASRREQEQIRRLAMRAAR